MLPQPEMVPPKESQFRPLARLLLMIRKELGVEPYRQFRSWMRERPRLLVRAATRNDGTAISVSCADGERWEWEKGKGARCWVMPADASLVVQRQQVEQSARIATALERLVAIASAEPHTKKRWR